MLTFEALATDDAVVIKAASTRSSIMKSPTFARIPRATLILLLGLLANPLAHAQDTFYYWVAPSPLTHRLVPNESFVIQVDASTADEIDAIRAVGVPGISGHIAVGAVDYNKDYFAPGHSVWNWHFASVDAVFDLVNAIFPQCECPYLVANPSDIAADPAGWIAANGPGYGPIAYAVRAKIDPSVPDAVANVSNRAFTGIDEKTAITGFIITGGEPRNVIVRGLGPSLAAQDVAQFVVNPQIEVFQGSSLVATNTDWKTDGRADVISVSYSVLVPSDDREAALLLTLLPGAYTVLTKAEDGSEGVVLTEVYDVDQSASTPTQVDKMAE